MTNIEKNGLNPNMFTTSVEPVLDMQTNDSKISFLSLITSYNLNIKLIIYCESHAVSLTFIYIFKIFEELLLSVVLAIGPLVLQHFALRRIFTKWKEINDRVLQYFRPCPFAD